MTPPLIIVDPAAALPRWQQAVRVHGAASTEAVVAGCDLLRAHLVNENRPSDWPVTDEVREQAEAVVAAAEATYGPGSVEAGYAADLATLLDHDPDNCAAVVDRNVEALGPDHPGSLELAALARLASRRWSRKRGKDTANRLAASPAYGPDHLFTLLCRGDLDALSERLAEWPLGVRDRVLWGLRNKLAKVDVPARLGPLELLSAELAEADGQLARAKLRYGVADDYLSHTDGKQSERAWRALVGALRCAVRTDTVSDNTAAEDARRRITGGRRALGATHPLIIEATELLAGLEPAGSTAPAAPDARAVLVEEVARKLPDHLDGSLAELHGHLEQVIEWLGEPLRVFGPDCTFMWHLADGALLLELEPIRGRWYCMRTLLDEAELRDWDEGVVLDTKVGEADTVTYLWCLYPPGGQDAEGEFTSGELELDDWRELRDATELTLAGIIEDLRVMPPRWEQTLQLCWTGPRSARAEVSIERVLLSIDGTVVLDRPRPGAGDVAELINATIDALAEYPLRRYVRTAKFSHAEDCALAIAGPP